jgi:cytochrome c oxidase cbb3-type subunit 2
VGDASGTGQRTGARGEADVKLDFHKDHRLLFGMILVGFIALALVIAVGPALWVNGHNAPLPGSGPLTADEAQGLRVYVSEGCPYCHTQQVRPLPQDRAFGRPSVPADYARLAWLDIWREPPTILGSERTGPDLSDVGNRQPSSTWQYMHLYESRAVVPWSVMPAFPWLFRVEEHPEPGAVVVPVPAPYAPAGRTVVATARAQALVAYLLGLKQAPLPGAAQPAAAAGAVSTAGASLYASRCATCHQANGAGLAGAFPSLVSDPVVTAADGAEHVRVVLFGRHGVPIGGVTYASEMPGWAQQLSDDDIAAVINHERTSWGNSALTVTPAYVGALRLRSPGGAGRP